MSTLTLEAEIRNDIGKGASRRQRRLNNNIPAILYGGDKEPMTILLEQHKVKKALETETIYSSIFNIKIKGKNEQVILKNLQRHPYKPIILHMDFQRVSGKDILVKQIPLHFINENISKGVKAGGVINHTKNQVEVRCQAQNLPGFIEVDMAEVNIDEVIHLSDLKLPKGVELAVDVNDANHNLPVVSIHTPKIIKEEEPVTEAAEAQEAGAAEESEESSSSSE